MSYTAPNPVRIDALTGIGNLLGFADLLLDQEQRAQPHTLLALVIAGLSALEQSHGDSALRWVALVLRDAAAVPVYRIGTDDFVALLPGDHLTEHREVALRLAARLDYEAGRLGLHTPAATMSLIHYGGSVRPGPAEVLGQISAALESARRSSETVTLSQSDALLARLDPLALAEDLIVRLAGLGGQLEISQQLAHRDPVTGMPNMRAAIERIDDALAREAAQQHPFALLLIDGDNLGRYNEIGYAAGDRMLIDLSQVLRDQLRPSDFLARWRSGDAFMVLLPSTGVSGAAALAERLRRRVELVSQYWPFPVSVSIGIAAFPQHGQGKDRLISSAEHARDRAKNSGKNRITVAEVVQ